MADYKVIQKGSTVGGDQAGGNIYKVTNHFEESEQSILYMKRLLKQFEEERTQDLKLNQIIEELEYFYSPLDGDVLGLEKKLADAKCQTLLPAALIAKERFRKKLEKYQFSEAAQKINVELLGRVFSRFQNQVAPKLQDDIPAQQVADLIQAKVVEPVRSALLENLMDITEVEINGMLYFLTGNCHIRWKN